MHYLKLRNKNDNFIWPSFVDALASLLIVIIFILMIFVISQYYISQKLSGKDQALIQLEAKILEITNQLSIEKEMTKRLSANIFNIQSDLDNKAESNYNKIINDQKKEVSNLNILISNLKEKINKLNSLLDVYEKKDKAEKIKNLQLKSTLNSALARRVEELQKFKSMFFGTVKEKIKNIPEIKIVGDRFVFQSEVLFETGSIEIGEKGKIELKKFAEILLNLDKDIPKDSNWILQIEGHTDNLPVRKGQIYKDNWELSTKRALSVLRYFINQGLDPKKLFASGYGSFQPIDNTNTKIGRMKNRRIEMKITQKLIINNDN